MDRERKVFFLKLALTPLCIIAIVELVIVVSAQLVWAGPMAVILTILAVVGGVVIGRRW